MVFTHLLTYLAIGLALNHQLGTGDLRTGWPLITGIFSTSGIRSCALISFPTTPIPIRIPPLCHRKVVQETYDHLVSLHIWTPHGAVYI